MPESAFDVQAMLAGRASLLRDACERGVAYLETVADRPVAPARKSVEGLLELGFPLPERGLGGRQALGLLDEIGSPARAQLASVEVADSWATDCHKWLNTTYDCGLALVADPGTLRRAMEATASYLPGSEAEAMGLTPQSSQRGRGVEVWAVLASLGRDGVAELVDRCCRLARRFADGMRSAGFEVRSDVVLNQVLISFGPAERTDSVIAAVQDEGTCWCGPTTWQGRRAMRVSVSGWSTTEEDIDRSIAAVRDCALRPT